jgi:hypothetical protein
MILHRDKFSSCFWGKLIIKESVSSNFWYSSVSSLLFFTFIRISRRTRCILNLCKNLGFLFNKCSSISDVKQVVILYIYIYIFIFISEKKKKEESQTFLIHKVRTSRIQLIDFVSQISTFIDILTTVIHHRSTGSQLYRPTDEG